MENRGHEIRGIEVELMENNSIRTITDRKY